MRYAELHCKTNFTFLEGASHADELVAQACALGYHALAITDRNSLAGVVRAYTATKDHPLKLIIGAEITLQDASPVVLWATNRAAYGRLSRLITVGRRRAEKGSCELRFDDLVELNEGLLAGVIARELSVDRPHSLHDYRELFGDRCYLLAELHRGPDDQAQLQEWVKLSRRMRVSLTAAGDVHYHIPARQVLQDVLVAIRHGQTVDEIRDKLFPNAQRHMQSLDDIARNFQIAPAAVRRTIEIADRCTFLLSELKYEYPEELAPPGLTPLEHLTQQTWLGAQEHYPDGLPDKVRELLEKELSLIGDLHYEAYFLTVWDLVRFARSRGILCQGRGSAANSAVCYCLGVTSVDPATSNVLFERFISKEREEAPDIDVDFEHERREEVLQYLYDKYGRERAGMTAVVTTYRPRSAIRDAGKALGLSLDRVDALAKQVEGYREEPRLAEHCQSVGIDPTSETGRRLVYVINELVGFPRHLSQHVGGMVLTQRPLCELAPIENAAMKDRTVIEWNKDNLDELGILKVDVLALGMLTAIRKCFAILRKYTGQELTLANVPPEDPTVYDMICKADTMGVFQIESRAQMSMLPRLQPRKFYDLVIEVAIVRPGPIQGKMVHPYLRRRAGEAVPDYPTSEIAEVLDKTLGVPLFQEQAMRLAVVAARFTPGEADQLRRAMAAWRRPGIIDQFRRKLIAGMRDRGLPEEFAELVYQQIQGFGSYGFPESHAASFARLVYISAWLKCHYPAAFTAALLNSQPLGFYAPSQLVRDLREHQIEVRPVDVNRSEWDCTLEGKDNQWALRLGLREVLGLPQTAAEQLVTERQQHGLFASLTDFAIRTQLPAAIITKLSDSDTFASLGNRRTMLWEALAQNHRDHDRPLLGLAKPQEAMHIPLPQLSPAEEVRADYRTTGLSLKAHPLSFYRAELDAIRITRAADLAQLRNGQFVRVAGLVLLRQRPGTAKGITFMTLEDETGVANLIVRMEVWRRFYKAARTASALIASGQLQNHENVVHVLVRKLDDMTEHCHGIAQKSRDFR